ncbi:MAG: pyridoxamine 5'-phosphate oxidase [Opitutales bacterium]
MDISALRREYTRAGLDRDALETDPVAQFRAWFEQAQKAELIEPNAMTVATTDAGGAPNVRTVLLKAYDERGFVFYTNYESQKAVELDANPQCALLFPWLGLERQVKIRGRAERVSTSESLRYFVSRPFGSRLGAWVSQQSRVISSRSLLEMKLDEMKRKFSDGEVPLPDFWGGYRVVPAEYEFWQGRQNRLHDRFRYRLEQDGAWAIERLSP